MFTVYFNNETIKTGFVTMQEALDYIDTLIKTTGYPKNGRYHI